MKKSWALFSKDLRQMSTEFFQEAMPVGKSWKKSRQSGVLCKLLTIVNLTNLKWFSVVCTLNNDIHHHSGQNVVDSRGASE